MVSREARLADLASNRPLTDDEVSRCVALASEIRRDPIGSEQSKWITYDGRSVYGVISEERHGVDRAFLETLRLRAFFFPGWCLENLLGAKHPSWTDNLAQYFPLEPGDPDWAVPAFFQLISGIPPRYVCSPPLVAGEVGYMVDGHLINRDVVAWQERINLLLKAGILPSTGDHKTIIEIGGGYGALCHYLHRMIDHPITYLIVDLPESLVFSGCYLAMTLGPDIVHVVDAGKPEMRSGCINLASPEACAQLPDFPIDIALNTLSFPEMSAETVDRYARFIAERLSEIGVVFEQNHENAVYDQNPHFCVPRRILERYFQHCQTIPGQYHWGVPRVWRR